jgi:hypothetical protein
MELGWAKGQKCDELFSIKTVNDGGMYSTSYLVRWPINLEKPKFD